MNNIFDFATKELSQDAFLGWFISNCNEEGIKEYSYEFINLITKFNFKFGDIKRFKLNNKKIIWTLLLIFGLRKILILNPIM